MTKFEIYKALRMFVCTYIVNERQQELLTILDLRESEGSFPPAKGIFADMEFYSNGVKLKPEHRELFDDICHFCI